ncbi:MAG: response regulator [Planctomycetota bacterium]|nr:MAG: response regulator [Planctomycetota bacterium]
MLAQPLELASPERASARHLVLIVDDDETISEALSIRLGHQGFDTLVARSGKAALEQARHQQPDCILLDLGLPDVDGFELCQDLVDSPNTCDIPVIIVSGMEHPRIIRRCRAAGCYYYVRKPYDPNVLLTLIRRAIDEAGGGEVEEIDA